MQINIIRSLSQIPDKPEAQNVPVLQVEKKNNNMQLPGHLQTGKNRIPVW